MTGGAVRAGADPTQDRLMQALLAQLEGAPDARVRQLMQALVMHLHRFIVEVDLQPHEWQAAVRFLVEAGQASTALRSELVLLSDVLGVSARVVDLVQGRCAEGATEATGAPCDATLDDEAAMDRALGADLCDDPQAGEPAFYAGRVTDTEGHPLTGALLDVGCGVPAGPAPRAARGRFRTDGQGRYWFWSVRPVHHAVPVDGPVGRLLRLTGRHPFRPAHVHARVSAPGHLPLSTQLFVADSPYLDSDVLFGVRDGLLVHFDAHPPGRAPDGRLRSTPYWSAHHDFRLAKALPAH